MHDVSYSSMARIAHCPCSSRQGHTRNSINDSSAQTPETQEVPRIAGGPFLLNYEMLDPFLVKTQTRKHKTQTRTPPRQSVEEQSPQFLPEHFPLCSPLVTMRWVGTGQEQRHLQLSTGASECQLTH